LIERAEEQNSSFAWFARPGLLRGAFQKWSGEMNAALADFIFRHAVFALKPRRSLGRVRDDAGRLAEDEAETRFADEADVFGAKLVAQIVDEGDQRGESLREGSEGAGEAVRFLALGDDGIERTMFAHETTDDGGVGGGFAIARPELEDFVEGQEGEVAAIAGKDVEVQSVNGTRFGDWPGIGSLGKDREVDAFRDDSLGEFAEKTGRAAVASSLFPEPA